MSAKLSLRLPRIGAAAKLALAVEGEEDVVDEVRRRPRLALENTPIGAEMPGERSQAAIGGREKSFERRLVLRIR